MLLKSVRKRTYRKLHFIQVQADFQQRFPTLRLQLDITLNTDFHQRIYGKKIQMPHNNQNIRSSA